MRKTPDIIYFTIFRWDNNYSSSSHSIAREAAKQGTRVFYINHPFTYKYFLNAEMKKVISRHRSKLLKGKPYEDTDVKTPENLHSIITPLMYPINRLPPGKTYEWWLAKNDKKVRDTIKFIINKFDVKDYIFINCFDPFYQNVLPKEHMPLVDIYQSVDDISQNPYTIRHGVEQEKVSVAKADMVITTSTNLKEIMSAYSNEVHTIHNAAAIDIFSRTYKEKFERPEEIKNITNKIIGFTGCLDAVRINFDLLYEIGVKHSDKTLLIVGPYDEAEMKKAQLNTLDNIIFTGAKNINDLPQYLHFMDCVIIPFARNTLTRSIYPLKINEYLASGKPVVSSNFSVDILTFKDVIHLAENDEDFINKINDALADQSEENLKIRLEVAQKNSWKARVEQLWYVVKDFNIRQRNKEVSVTELANSGLKDNKSGIVRKLDDRPALKSFLHWCLIPKNDYKPRWWVRHLLTPLIHTRGKGSKVRRKARIDVLPNNTFHLGERVLIEDFAVLNNAVGDLIIGDRSLVGISSTVIGPVTIGNDVMLAQNIVISGLNHGYEDIKYSIREQLTITNPILIKDEAWIGANSVIVAGITIGKHSIVAAGSVVTKDVPDYTIVAGNPARIVKQYNFDENTWEKVKSFSRSKTEEYAKIETEANYPGKKQPGTLSQGKTD